MADFLPPDYQRVLEIGCGSGVFKCHLKPVQTLWGIEPNEEASKQAATQGYHVLNDIFENCVDQLPDNHFDLIICNDVIEHLVDHDAFFEVIKQKLAGGGVIVGSIPNIRYYKVFRKLLFQREWIYEDAGVLDRTHLRFFTEKSLKRCFNEHNYHLEQFGGINKTRGFKMFIAVCQLLSLGAWSDIKFLQFAFRIKPAS